ncbi:MAG: hypothetical protein AAGE94_00575 [Acidobacteriota bacterium]
MRSESANRFADGPAPVPAVRCDLPVFWQARVLLESEQDLVFTSDDGQLYNVPMPEGVALPLDGVRWTDGPPPRVVMGELWRDGVPPTETPWLDSLRGVPDHGDVLVLDLDGRLVARHPIASGAMPSPDGRWLAMWRSNVDGRHNLFVAPIDDPTLRFVGALTESDPGSGASFSACWSADGRSVQVHGDAYGVGAFHWIYELSSSRLYREAETPPIPRQDEP